MYHLYICRMTECSADDFYQNVAEFRKYAHSLYHELERKLQKYYKTTKGKKQAKIEKDYKNYWGMTKKEYDYWFKSTDWSNSFKWEQDSKSTNKIPRVQHRSQYISFTARDTAAMGSFCDSTFYYGKIKRANAKWNQNLPITEPQSDEIIDDTQIHWVPLGDTDSQDEQSKRELYHLYYASHREADSSPYKPDLTFSTNNEYYDHLRLYIRNLFYGFFCILKCNVIINPADTATQTKLMENDKSYWYEAKQLKIQILNNLFFDAQFEGINQAFDVSMANNFVEDIMQFLTKDDSVSSGNNFVLKGDSIIFNKEGLGGLKKYYGSWRPPRGDRDDNEHEYDEFMINLVNYVSKNECLCAIKSIEYIASRIANIIACDEEQSFENDSLLIVKCIELILAIFEKGDISKFHQVFMPLPGYIADYDINGKISKLLYHLDSSTQLLLQSIRAISNLGAFNFEFLVTKRKLTEIWFVFFIWALYSMLYGARLFQICLGKLMQYVDKIPEQAQVGMLCKFML